MSLDVYAKITKRKTCLYPLMLYCLFLMVSRKEKTWEEWGGGCAPGISIRVDLWDWDLEYVDVVVIVRVRTRVLIQVICSVAIQPSFIVQGSC